MINEGYNSCCHKIVSGESLEKGNLYLGNLSSTNKDVMDKLQIKAVITVALGANLTLKNVEHMVIEAMDDEEYKINRHFHKSIAFIKKYIEQTNVLVHCFAGVSRSVTIVAAYLMMTKKLISSQEALKYIQQIRQIAGPNEGFIEQLKQFETKIDYQNN